MFNFRVFSRFALCVFLLGVSILPVFAVEYNSGVEVDQYVKYGNFVGIGPGFESFNDYDWLKLQVTDVSGTSVTLLSTGQFKNGDPIPGNGTSSVWDVAAGTEDGIPNTQGPIIASNLNQGDEIPPPNTYIINKTENRAYLSVTRSVNILNVSLSTPDYNTTLLYVYDRASGMLLESTSQTVTQGQPEPVTSTYSYSAVETNIFGSPAATASPSPTIPEFPSTIVLCLLTAVMVFVAGEFLRKKF
jgi:hypothetical protein